MRLLLGHDAEVAEWVAARIARIDHAAEFGPCTALGVVSDTNQAVAGVVFSNYRPRFKSIEISCAADSPRWLTRKLACAIFRYPFVQLDCARVTAITPKRSRHVRAFLEGLGFRREGVCRKGFGDDHAVVYGLLRTEWMAGRWARAEASPLRSRRPQPDGEGLRAA